MNKLVLESYQLFRNSANPTKSKKFVGEGISDTLEVMLYRFYMILILIMSTTCHHIGRIQLIILHICHLNRCNQLPYFNVKLS